MDERLEELNMLHAVEAARINYALGGGNPNHDEKGRFAEGPGGGSSYKDSPTGSAHVSVKSTSGQVTLKQPKTLEDKVKMLEAMNKIHAKAMKEHKEAQKLPENHPDRVAAALRANHVTQQLARAQTMAAKVK